MTKFYLSILLVFLGHLTMIAQLPDYNKRADFLKANANWVFGKGAGLDFNNGAAASFSTAMFSEEGCAAVSDPLTGKLLFYSNGGKVWNARHEVMPNGRNLLGNARYQYKYIKNSQGDTVNIDTTVIYSTVQGVSIVPLLNEPGKYYLFSLSGLTSGGPKPEGTLFYNIVDMNLNNGLGDVINGKKNITLDRDTLAEAMVAIPGNNCDVWLTVHHQRRNEFRAYHITLDGIDPNPVVSLSGYLPGDNYFIGSMAVTPDRSKIAITAMGAGVLLGHFNPATGIASGHFLANYGSSFLGVCFSPDNSKMYLAAADHLAQLDISIFDTITILSSVKQIVNAPTAHRFFLLRLYNDTIYLGEKRTNTRGVTHVNRINRPNLADTACSYQAKAIVLTSGDTSLGYLDNEVAIAYPPDTALGLLLDTLLCSPSYTLGAPEGFVGYVWEDGSTSARREVTVAGVYKVLSRDACHSRIDSFVVRGLGWESPIITIDLSTLRTLSSYESYQWLLDGQAIAGATDSAYMVTENGKYQVVVKRGGCSDTSDAYVVTNAEDNVEELKAINHSISVYPNPAKDIVHIRAPFSLSARLLAIDGSTVQHWQDIEKFSLKLLPDGLYFLRLMDKSGRLLKVEKIVIRH